MDQNKIGEIIEKKRKEKNLTQKELSEALGVSNTAVSKWENGNNLPDISMLEPLCKILDLDLLELITTQNSMKEDTSKKFAKIRKVKLCRTIILALIFISLLCITNIFTYNRVMSKRKEDLSKDVEVYKITSTREDFKVNGYVIFNEKDNLIFLENVLYQGLEDSNIDYDKLKSATYLIKLDKEIVVKRKIDLSNKKVTKLNEVLDIIKNISSSSAINLKNNKNKFYKLIFIVEVADKNNEKISVETNLILSRIFI